MRWLILPFLLLIPALAMGDIYCDEDVAGTGSGLVGDPYGSGSGTNAIQRALANWTKGDAVIWWASSTTYTNQVDLSGVTPDTEDMLEIACWDRGDSLTGTNGYGNSVSMIEIDGGGGITYAFTDKDEVKYYRIKVKGMTTACVFASKDTTYVECDFDGNGSVYNIDADNTWSTTQKYIGCNLYGDSRSSDVATGGWYLNNVDRTGAAGNTTTEGISCRTGAIGNRLIMDGQHRGGIGMDTTDYIPVMFNSVHFLNTTVTNNSYDTGAFWVSSAVQGPVIAFNAVENCPTNSGSKVSAIIYTSSTSVGGDFINNVNYNSQSPLYYASDATPPEKYFYLWTHEEPLVAQFTDPANGDFSPTDDASLAKSPYLFSTGAYQQYLNTTNITSGTHGGGWLP